MDRHKADSVQAALTLSVAARPALVVIDRDLPKAERLVQELALGAQESALIESAAGLVLCRQVVNGITPMVLLVVTGENSNPGYALWAVKKAARALGESLSAPGSGAPTTSEREQ